MSSIDLISNAKVLTDNKGLRSYWQNLIQYFYTIGGRSVSTASFEGDKILDDSPLVLSSGDDLYINGVKWPKTLEENKPLYVYSTDELRFGDASTIPGFYFTGEVVYTILTTAPDGWIVLDDGTIGNSGSGASTRANSDTETLYTLLWTNIPDTYCPVSSGRGASAANDFAIGKTLRLPQVKGRTFGVYGSGSGLTSRVIGETAGAETHALTTAELPSHTHTFADISSSFNVNFAGPKWWASTETVNSGTAGSGTAHNNMQPTTFLNAIIKL